MQNAPKSAYRHVLVAVDFSETAGALVRYAGGCKGEARLELYHAIDRRNEAKLRSAEASMQAIQAYRAEVREQARQKMLPLATALDTRRNRVASVLGSRRPGPAACRATRSLRSRSHCSRVPAPPGTR